MFLSGGFEDSNNGEDSGDGEDRNTIYARNDDDDDNGHVSSTMAMSSQDI